MEELLERYWQCQTTLDEEAQLRAFFATDQVPPHLLPYQALFNYQLQEQTTLSEEFDRRLAARLGSLPVKAKRITLRTRLLPLGKAVAAVAAVLLLGGVVQRSFLPGSKEIASTDTVKEQITAPSVALGNAAALREKQRLDSLERLHKKDEQTKRVP